MAKKNSIISVTVSDGGDITFAVEGAGTFPLVPSVLSDDIRNRAMIHGLVQKISDGAAIPKAELEGLSPAQIAERKFNAMRAIADRIVAGDWSKRSGDGSGSVAGIIFAAFHRWACEMAAAKNSTPPTEETSRRAYDARDRAGQLALRKIPRIAEIIEEIKSERGASATEIDVDDILGELGI